MIIFKNTKLHGDQGGLNKTKICMTKWVLGSNQ